MSPTWYRSALSLAILGGLSACGGAGGGGTGLDGADRTLTWQREIVYEVGGAEAEGWAAFGRIAGVGFDEEGRLYVLDSQAKQVHLLAGDGTLERSMGTPGQGPGELGQVAGMTVFPDGTVSVFDFSKFSMVVYGPDGKWLRDVRVDPTQTGLLGAPLLPMPYHTVLGHRRPGDAV
jgi:hypothetical protein